MLDSAEFTTLRRVLPRDLRLEPKPGFSIGKDIALGRKLRDPEAMDDVSTSHPERHCPTYRHVQLVGGGQVVFRIAEFPPPLMAHHLDRQGVLPWGGVGLKDGADCGNGDGGEDQRGNDGPDDFHRGVAVGLVRLRIFRFTPESENRVDQHSFYQHEHEQRPLYRGVEQAVGNAGKIAAGKECGLGIVLRATADEPNSEQAERGDPPGAPGSGPQHCAFILFVRAIKVAWKSLSQQHFTLDPQRCQGKRTAFRHAVADGIFCLEFPQAWRSHLRADSFLRLVAPMIREMQEKLGREIDQLSHELNILLPQAIAQAVELGDLRENSEYKAALERQQFVQARLGQLHQRLNQLGQLANTEAPTDRVGLGSRVTVLDLDTKETDTYVVVLAEMMDIDAGHISLASPLGRALGGGKVGEEVSLRLPAATRKLRIIDLVTVHQAEAGANGAKGDGTNG